MKQLFLLTLLLGGVLFCRAAKVDTIQIYSDAMHRSYKCTVFTPDTYKDKNNRYPVVYMLHGYGGGYADWAKNVPAVKELADAYQMMIVCPDGAVGSWYIDSPIDTSMRFETYVGTEIPAYIDAHYHTKAERKYRAITGLSMGGHGALFLAIRHQQTFGAAGAMSGGVDLRPFPKNWDLSKRLGTEEEHPENWAKYSVVNQLDSLKNGALAITFDCGVKDFFLEVNRQLHQKLIAQGIDHDYAERPGEHNWKYWSNSIVYQLLFFHRFFNAPSK